MKHSGRLPVGEAHRPHREGVGEMRTFHLKTHSSLQSLPRCCCLCEKSCCLSAVKNRISSARPEGFELFSSEWVSSCGARESSDDRLGFHPLSETPLSLRMTTAFCSPVLASVSQPRRTYCPRRQRLRLKMTANHGQRQTAGENRSGVMIRKSINDNLILHWRI